MNTSTAPRRALLVLFLVLCQGLLVLHDGQHIAPDSSQCAVCQAHSPQITQTAADTLVPVPVFVTLGLTRLIESTAHTTPALLAFRSRAPPHRFG